MGDTATGHVWTCGHVDTGGQSVGAGSVLLAFEALGIEFNC